MLVIKFSLILHKNSKRMNFKDFRLAFMRKRIPVSKFFKVAKSDKKYLLPDPHSLLTLLLTFLNFTQKFQHGKEHIS